MKNIKRLILSILLCLSFNIASAADPELSSNTSLFLVFDSANNPTATEPNVNAIGIPQDWLYSWYNHTTKDVYDYKGGANGAYRWDLRITPENIANYVNIGSLNTLRNYSSISLALDTSRIPSATRDVLVIVNISQTSTLLTAATANVQIDTGSGFTTICSPSISGLAATQINTCTFIVPKGASYQVVVASGNNSISGNVFELSF